MKGWQQMLLMGTVDRRSPQDFAHWGRDLAAALGLSFELNHQPEPPKTAELRLLSRRDYGADVQAPTSILRFALPEESLWRKLSGRGFPRFEAGHLIGLSVLFLYHGNTQVAGSGCFSTAPSDAVRPKVRCPDPTLSALQRQSCKTAAG